MLMKFDSEKNINKSLAITDLIQQYIKVIHSRVNWYTEGFIQKCKTSSTFKN